MFTTRIEYFDKDTGEVIHINKWELPNWEVKTVETITIKKNVNDYERIIFKTARKSRQTKIEW